MMSSFKRRFLLFSGFILLLILGFSIAVFLNTDFWALQNSPFESSKLNILVVGYDSLVNGSPRADTIILASIDLKTKDVGLLSIPRDTRVDIPGHGMNRVNASHAFGGIELTDKTLELFLDVPIDYYVETNFNGFAKIVDSLDGVEINISQPLHYVDKAGDLYIDLPAGQQVLNGDEALQYVRYRESIEGDIGRVARQQKFIKAMFKKVLRPDIVMKLPGIYTEVKKTVNTNIPLQDISPFIHLLKDMDMNNFKTVMLPGQPKYINGASYWLADEKELDVVVNNLIRSKEFIRNSRICLGIYNGNGQVGLAGQVSDQLGKYGFVIDRIANADHYNYQETRIKYYDRANEATALNIQKVLGGKVIYEESTREGEKAAANKEDISIIIGNDYNKASEDKITG